MIFEEEHGGECCGRYHLWGFPNRPREGAVNLLKKTFKNEFNNKMCCEVTLTEQQAITKGYGDRDWNSYLTRTFGFRRVMKWRNPNSGNIVYCYLRSAAEIK